MPDVGRDAEPVARETSLNLAGSGSIFQNLISDISPLGGLTNLTFLDLLRNFDLSNIQPLLNNTGLGASATVGLADTSVSCGSVAALETKGVLVQEGRYNDGGILEENCL